MLWECPRAQNLWVYLRNLIRQSYGIEYISYETIVLGNEDTIPLIENLIVLSLRLIMVKDRSTEVTVERLENRIKTQYFIEKASLTNAKFQNRWGTIEQHLFGHRD